MERFLVAFERPSSVSNTSLEEAWDRWVDHELTPRGLQLVEDLDPVAAFGDIEVYEAVSL